MNECSSHTCTPHVRNHVKNTDMRVTSNTHSARSRLAMGLAAAQLGPLGILAHPSGDEGHPRACISPVPPRIKPVINHCSMCTHLSGFAAILVQKQLELPLSVSTRSLLFSRSHAEHTGIFHCHTCTQTNRNSLKAVCGLQ